MVWNLGFSWFLKWSQSFHPPDCHKPSQAPSEPPPHCGSADPWHDLPVSFPTYLEGLRILARPSYVREGCNGFSYEDGGRSWYIRRDWGRNWYAAWITSRHYWEYGPHQVSLCSNIDLFLVEVDLLSNLLHVFIILEWKQYCLIYSP